MFTLSGIGCLRHLGLQPYSQWTAYFIEAASFISNTIIAIITVVATLHLARIIDCAEIHVTLEHLCCVCCWWSCCLHLLASCALKLPVTALVQGSGAPPPKGRRTTRWEAFYRELLRSSDQLVDQESNGRQHDAKTPRSYPGTVQ